MTFRPHGRNLRKGRYSQDNQIYHVISSTYERLPVFSDLYTGRLFVKALIHEQESVQTLAYVLMPDHFHWLMQLCPGADLSESVGRVKSASARQLNKHLGRKGPIWQSGFYDHAVRKDEDIRDIARYIVANPLRAGLVKSMFDYPLWDAIWV
jgi:REP element-mobilizing transposase RayT